MNTISRRSRSQLLLRNLKSPQSIYQGIATTMDNVQCLDGAALVNGYPTQSVMQIKLSQEALDQVHGSEPMEVVFGRQQAWLLQ